MVVALEIAHDSEFILLFFGVKLINITLMSK